MKFTLSWLKDHLATDASLDAIVERLTTIGLEVEAVEDRAAALSPFVIARVREAKQHPNADRLKVLTVDAGGDSIQVICGAPNAREGLVGVFAAPGAHIPGTGINLEVGTIRGVESRGMMLSEREMGLSDEHDGIVELPADAPIGTSYVSWADLADPVIEVGVTPNRGDCFGVRGIARDLAATGIGTLKPLIIPQPVVSPDVVTPTVTLSFGDGPSLCSAFGLCLIEGVENGPSPSWMTKRLTAIGLRPINRLVDVTNYVSYDLGRPLHVFDADRVSGDIVVRNARDGEEVLALDGKTYTLNPSMCVIADDNGVESLAGVMGGEASGCHDGTTRVLVESALWEPINIARTGRALGIHSDARHRFERGVDPAFTLPGLDHATALILSLCGGRAGNVTLAGDIADNTRTIQFPPQEVKRLSNLDVADDTSATVLTALGFEVDRSASPWAVKTPPWRGDVEGKADLVEEVVRIIGIDDVPPTPLERLSPVAQKILTVRQSRVATARRALAARGMVEAVTWSFISHNDAVAFGGGDPSVRLDNPIAEALSDMRPSLLPGLIHAVVRNVNRGHPNVALFEVGQVFGGDEPSDQTTSAAGLRQGKSSPSRPGRHWSHNGGAADLYDVKADLLAVLESIGGPAARAEPTRDAPAYYHPGRSGVLRLGPKVLATFGELHPAVLMAMDAPERLVAFELTLEAVPEPRRKTTRKPAFHASDLMPVRRDFAFVVPEAVDARAITKAALGARKDLVSDAAVFDVYRGTGLADGHKSVAIEVTLQPTDKTLTDRDIEGVADAIVAAVTKATGATLRG